MRHPGWGTVNGLFEIGFRVLGVDGRMGSYSGWCKIALIKHIVRLNVLKVFWAYSSYNPC